MSYVDLHTHILPGVDDGSPDIETSMTMVSGLMDLGFSTICATPHQKTDQYLPSLETIGSAHRETTAAVAERGMNVTIPLAAENMWDSTLYERMESDEIPGYDGNRVFLLEFIPTQLPVGLFERIFDLRCRGILPVIAHPERYIPLWKAPDLLEKLAGDCAMVVDLGALSGHHGRKQAKQARKMVLGGTAHAAASDLHSPGNLKCARAGIEWIRKKAGSDAVQRLLGTNPAKILDGKHPDG
ncbi:MAG: hypothetical protein GY811_00530 [Myxococcales bacterium]|nr:hypothetical protein [Myxococcales bacterium]